MWITGVVNSCHNCQFYPTQGRDKKFKQNWLCSFCIRKKSNWTREQAPPQIEIEVEQAPPQIGIEVEQASPQGDNWQLIGGLWAGRGGGGQQWHWCSHSGWFLC